MDRSKAYCIKPHPPIPEKTGYLAGKGVLWLKLTRYINWLFSICWTKWIFHWLLHRFPNLYWTRDIRLISGFRKPYQNWRIPNFWRSRQRTTVHSTVWQRPVQTRSTFSAIRFHPKSVPKLMIFWKKNSTIWKKKWLSNPTIISRQTISLKCSVRS